MGVVVLVSVAGFALLHNPVRRVEAEAAVAVLRLTGSDRAFVAPGSSIQVLPAHQRPFRAVVTPTCSSLSSLLTLGCLASLTPRRRRLRVVATLAALATVLVGNIVRISASVGVGLLFGRSSLILFHDWVGSVFAFGYTLGGYILLLYLLLPSRPRVTERSPCQQPRSSSAPSASVLPSWSSP
jgi:exosortase/archaeosortase family protein